jgi:hypothetical protein
MNSIRIGNKSVSRVPCVHWKFLIPWKNIRKWTELIILTNCVELGEVRNLKEEYCHQYIILRNTFIPLRVSGSFRIVLPIGTRAGLPHMSCRQPDPHRRLSREPSEEGDRNIFITSVCSSEYRKIDIFSPDCTKESHYPRFLLPPILIRFIY